MANRLHIQEDFTPTGVMSIVDSLGQTIQVTDSASGKQLPDKLNVIVEATHTGINRNKVYYSHDNLAKSVDSWTKNYGKPVLLNHNDWSDPLGRVKSAEFKQSAIDPEKHTIQLSLEIANKDAIERFLDGRYSTFSIGGYTDSATCSICGKDLMKDGFCGHQRGKTYDGKECYWNLGMMDYDEISVVNCPADVHAQAIQVNVVGEDGKPVGDATGTGEEPPVNEPTGTQGDANNGNGKVTDSILDDIDGILGNKDGDTNEPPASEGDKTEGEGEGEGAGNPEGEGDNNEPPTTEPTGGQGDSVEELKGEITKLNDKVTTLEAEILTKDGTITAKDSEIQTISEERDSLKTELNASKEEAEGLVKQNAALAKFAHSILAEKVVDLQIVYGEKKLEDKEALLKDYATVTSKKLNDMINELMKPEKVVQRVKVTSPGVVADGDGNDGDGFVGAGNQKTEITVEDAVNTMKDFFVKRQI